MKKKIRQNKGFTLFELMVTISIIAILVALASVSYSVAQKKGRDAKRMEDMKAIQNAAEQYYSLSGSIYPPAVVAGNPWTINSQVVLEAFPKDPKSIGWTAYSYSLGTTYCACAALENSTGGNSVANNCDFTTGGTKNYFCVKSQQ